MKKLHAQCSCLRLVTSPAASGGADQTLCRRNCGADLPLAHLADTNRGRAASICLVMKALIKNASLTVTSCGEPVQPIQPSPRKRKHPMRPSPRRAEPTNQNDPSPGTALALGPRCRAVSPTGAVQDDLWAGAAPLAVTRCSCWQGSPSQGGAPSALRPGNCAPQTTIIKFYCTSCSQGPPHGGHGTRPDQSQFKAPTNPKQM